MYNAPDYYVNNLNHRYIGDSLERQAFYNQPEWCNWQPRQI